MVPGSDSEPQGKSMVKDLGEVVSYNKSVSLGFVRDKIDEAVSRLQRLEWIPASLAVKAKLIQSAVWPLALYSTDTTYIGQQHFTTSRSSRQDSCGKMAQCLKCHWLQLPFEISA